MDHSEENGCECKEAQFIDPHAPCFCWGEDNDDGGICQCWGEDPYDTAIAACRCYNGYFGLPYERYYDMSDDCFCSDDDDVLDPDSLCYCIHNDLYWDEDYEDCQCRGEFLFNPDSPCYCYGLG